MANNSEMYSASTYNKPIADWSISSQAAQSSIDSGAMGGDEEEKKKKKKGFPGNLDSAKSGMDFNTNIPNLA